MQPWTFLHICDMQPGSPRSYRFNPRYRENWETALKQLAEIDADLVLVGGDLTRDGYIHDYELETVRSELQSLPYPFFAVPGNMDTGNKHAHQGGGTGRDDRSLNVTAEQLDRFTTFFGEFPWTTLHKNVRFSGLYAALAGSGLPHEERMWKWLEEELPAAPRADHHVMIMHYTLFVNEMSEETWDLTDGKVYADWYFSIDKPERLRMFEALKASGVSLVLSGHIHCRRPAQEVDGVRFIKCPGIAMPQWNTKWEDGDPRLGFMRFEVTDEGIQETFVPLTYESEAEGAYGPGGHPPPEDRDYSLAWEK